MQMNKSIAKLFGEWRLRRQIKDYCRSQSSRPHGARFFNCLLLYAALCAAAFWKAATFRELLGYLVAIKVLMVTLVTFLNRREFAREKNNCLKKLGEQEFSKRLEKADDEEILSLIRDQISLRFPVFHLEMKDGFLQGLLKNEKVAVFYRPLEEEEVLQTKDVMVILHECRQKGFKQVRIFTNRDFSHKAASLGERYDLTLRLYNGDKLKAFLRESRIFPTAAEAESILKRESEKRQRKLMIIKKELVQGNKFRTYCIYSLILVGMAWYGIGVFYWNLFFSLLLLGLAVFSLAARREKEAEDIIII